MKALIIGAVAVLLLSFAVGLFVALAMRPTARMQPKPTDRKPEGGNRS